MPTSWMVFFIWIDVCLDEVIFNHLKNFSDEPPLCLLMWLNSPVIILCLVFFIRTNWTVCLATLLFLFLCSRLVLFLHFWTACFTWELFWPNVTDFIATASKCKCETCYRLHLLCSLVKKEWRNIYISTSAVPESLFNFLH